MLAIYRIVTGMLTSWVGGYLGRISSSLSEQIIGPLLDYIWINADKGYFVDFPEDTKRKNSVANIIHRAKVTLSSDKNFCIGEEETNQPQPETTVEEDSVSKMKRELAEKKESQPKVGKKATKSKK